VILLFAVGLIQDSALQVFTLGIGKAPYHRAKRLEDCPFGEFSQDVPQGQVPGDNHAQPQEEGRHSAPDDVEDNGLVELQLIELFRGKRNRFHVSLSLGFGAVFRLLVFRLCGLVRFLRQELMAFDNNPATEQQETGHQEGDENPNH